MHQAAEYLVALVLVAGGTQSTTPLWPALCGLVVLANVAFSGPPLGAFRLAPRALHSRLDLVVVAVLLVVAVLPFLGSDATSRLTIAGGAAVLALIWWGSDFSTAGARRRQATSAGRVDAESVGRFAGRLVNRAGALRKRE